MKNYITILFLLVLVLTVSCENRRPAQESYQESTMPNPIKVQNMILVNKKVEIPFDRIGKKLIIELQNNCILENNSYVLETLVSGISYRVKCKTSDTYSTPVELVENFNFSDNVLKDMATSGHYSNEQIAALKNQPTSLLHKNEPWGKVFRWSTPSTGGYETYYINPKDQSYSFKVTHRPHGPSGLMFGLKDIISK